MVLSFKGLPGFVIEEIVNLIVDCGAVPVLVQHLQAPVPVPIPSKYGEALTPYEHEVEKGSALTLGFLAIKVSRSLHHFFLIKNL